MELATQIQIKTAAGEQQATIADLMGIALDSIAPVYGFEALEAGQYRFRIKEFDVTTVDVKVDKKDANSPKVARPKLTFKCEVVDVIKTKDATADIAALIGKDHNESFFITDLKEGLGKCVAFLQGAGLANKGPLQTLCEQSINREFIAVVNSRKDKDNPTISYSNIDLKAMQPATPAAPAAPAGLALGGLAT